MKKSSGQPVFHDNRMLAERAFYCLCQRHANVAMP